jgi:YegS/Rv2252/BmrU family lipid kinase
MECLLIINSNANKGKTAKLQEEIIKAFDKIGYNYKVIRTKGADDARTIAYESVGYFDLIAACGGDGTINEVVDGLLKRSQELNLSIEKKPVLAIFPIGRGNDFAWSLNIKSYDIKSVINNIKNNKQRVIDVGWAKGGRFPNGSFFVNGLGIGFEPTVNFRASKYKRVSGTMSYLLAFANTLAHYPKAMNLRICINGGLAEEINSQQLSVGNGKRMGGAFLMCPKAKVDDGALDFVFAYKPISRYNIFFVALKFFKGKQLNDTHFRMELIKSLIVESDKDNMVVHIDGEMVGTSINKIEILLKEKALAIIC